MYLNLDLKFLEKTKEKATKESVSQMGEDGKNNGVWDIENETLENLEITDTEISADFDSELGWVSVKIPLDADTLEQIISVAIKRMNKIRSLLESVK